MLQNLLQRRVPQIIGLYIAATWMAIEIGDWVTARFSLPLSLTSYIFLIMLAMLPSVIVLAWYHGAPGKDRWTRVEKTFVPLNLLIAAVLTTLVAEPPAGVEATEIRELVDETGEVQTFEVPRAGFARRLGVFFFDNRTGDGELDWLSYALPLMITHDLNHETPLVSAVTPFHSEFVKEELRRKGFAEALGAPRALQLQIAKSFLSDVMLSGEIRTVDERAVVAMSIVDVGSGERLARIERPAGNWLALADGLSLEVQRALRLEDAQLGENDPLTDNLSSSIDAIRAYSQARVAVEIDNDYATAAALLAEAVAYDSTFAEAYSQLSIVQYFSGQSQDALASANQAFTHDYRLSLATKFRLRALRYQYAGDSAASRRVLNMWTEVQPENPDAFRFLGRFLLFDGNAHDAAREAFGRMLELNPSAHESYLLQATVEKTRGDLEEASDLVTQYLGLRPDDPDGHLMLASISLAAGNLDAARRAYEDAGNLGADTVKIEHGVAILDIRLGEVDAARSRLNQLLERGLTPAQRVQTLNLLLDTQYVEGRLRDAIATLDRLDQAGRDLLPPVQRILQVGATRSNMYTLLGEFDLARREIEQIEEKLQPPLDRYVSFWLLVNEAEAGDDDAFRAALSDALAFYRDSGNQALAPFMLWARAHGAWLDNDLESASSLVAEAIESYERSFVQSLSESALALESKIQMYRMLIGLGELDQARAYLEAVIDKAPATGTAHQLLAKILILQEDLQGARRHVDRALHIWRHADPAYLRLVETRELQAALR